ncbi:elongation factor P hydroxylase [Colwelliaceae bacterium 6441]
MTLFNQCFYAPYRTKLVKGEEEPVYLPANEHCADHQIIFAHGFYSSALHEISHWCLAGAARRQLEDFGYWYLPDGRNAEQQKSFEQVEIKPQAIEWAFCVAAKKQFNVSADNLSGVEVDTFNFKLSVLQQVKAYLTHGFPARAQQFIDALACFYQVELPLTIKHFTDNNEVMTKELYDYV